MRQELDLFTIVYMNVNRAQVLNYCMCIASVLLTRCPVGWVDETSDFGWKVPHVTPHQDFFLSKECMVHCSCSPRCVLQPYVKFTLTGFTIFILPNIIYHLGVMVQVENGKHWGHQADCQRFVQELLYNIHKQLTVERSQWHSISYSSNWYSGTEIILKNTIIT